MNMCCQSQSEYFAPVSSDLLCMLNCTACLHQLTHQNGTVLQELISGFNLGSTVNTRFDSAHHIINSESASKHASLPGSRFSCLSQQAEQAAHCHESLLLLIAICEIVTQNGHAFASLDTEMSCDKVMPTFLPNPLHRHVTAHSNIA